MLKALNEPNKGLEPKTRLAGLATRGFARRHPDIGEHDDRGAEEASVEM